MLTTEELSGYLQRVGFDAGTDTTPETLAALARAHALSIPFENIEAFLGRRVSLDPPAVFDKLVRRRLGGWCFEQNLLLGSALRALGFDVTDLAGRVLWGRTADAVTPRTHRALLVRDADRQWLVDVGFGGQSITGALDMARTDAQRVGHDCFRLSPSGSGQLLMVRIRGEWLPMYRFDLQPQLPVDFEAANFQLCQDPASHFTQALMLSRAAEDGRHALRDRELAFHDQAGQTTRRSLRDSAEVLGVLESVFGLRLDAATAQQLRAKF